MKVKAHAVVAHGRVELGGTADGCRIIADSGECASTVFFNGIVAVAPASWICPLSKVDAAQVSAAASFLADAIPPADSEELREYYIPLG